ncbi:MAG: GNAT family N-acetyltransferase [Clostridiales bacterium]|jgi:ribosomal protein S18 acetylase RimI-like enzyme|nr:GNAT family N-acetyltransferase [Clostridiales bacterium]
MAIKIRKAEEKDIPCLLTLLDTIRELHHKGRPDVFRDNGTKYNEKQLKEKLNSPEEGIFVAYDGETFLGYICTVIKEYIDHNILLDKKVLYVDDLCVIEESRGRGVGRMLMDEAKDFAKANKCVSLELNVWKFDGSAEGFYRSYGFTTMSRRMEYRLY